MSSGLLGRKRGIGFGILMTIVTFGIVIPGIVWFVKVQDALNTYWDEASAAAPMAAAAHPQHRAPPAATI